MEYPLAEFLDRLSISKLKSERIKEQCCIDEFLFLQNSLSDYKVNFDLNDFIDKLYNINAKIWDIESDIRKGKDKELGLEEIGRRTIKLRELNKIRVSIKNEVVKKSGLGFVDVKMNHASE